MVSYLDWPAMIVLMTAYVVMARHPRAFSLLVTISDAMWTAFALATQQWPLLVVSVFCGALALRSFLVWRDPKLKPATDPEPGGGNRASLHSYGRAVDFGDRRAA